MKCKKCFSNCQRFAPILVDSGYHERDGRDLVCPVCNALYSSRTGEEFNQEEYNRKIEQKNSIREYNQKWFS